MSAVLFRSGWTPPSFTHASDVALGVTFVTDVPIALVALAWYMEDVDAPDALRGLVWDSDETLIGDTGTIDTSNRTHYPTSAFSPVDGLAFASPLILPAGTYTAAVYLDVSSGLGYSDGDLASPIVSPDTHVTLPAGGGVFGSGASFPGSSWNGMHGIGLWYDLSTGSTAVLAGVLGSPSMAVEADATATAALAGSLGSPVLASSVAASASAGLAGMLQRPVLAVTATAAGAAALGGTLRRPTMAVAVHADVPTPTSGGPGRLTSRGTGSGLTSRGAGRGLVARGGVG